MGKLVLVQGKEGRFILYGEQNGIFYKTLFLGGFQPHEVERAIAEFHMTNPMITPDAVILTEKSFNVQIANRVLLARRNVD